MKLDRIPIDSERMNGQPAIRGLRLTVKLYAALAMFRAGKLSAGSAASSLK